MRVHALRLTPGADLKEELQRITALGPLGAGFILSCVGSLSAARLRAPSTAGEADLFHTYAEPMEIVSLVGTLSPDGIHVHISLSRRDGACVGGHLVSGCIVNTTAELVIGEAEGLKFRRLPDRVTGYAELSIKAKSSEGAPSIDP